MAEETAKFAKFLYIGKSLEKEYRKVIRHLKRKKASLLVYLAVILPEEEQVFLVHNGIYLANYHKSGALIVGLALGKREGMKLLRDIVQDTLSLRGDLNTGAFVMEREKA